MLRKQVKPLELDMRKEKKKDYKSVVAEIQMKAKSSTPKVEPITQRDWHSKPSRYASLPEAGITNGLVVAPSFTGKTTWLSSWILDWYRGVLRSYLHLFAQRLHP